MTGFLKPNAKILRRKEETMRKILISVAMAGAMMTRRTACSGQTKR